MILLRKSSKINLQSFGKVCGYSKIKSTKKPVDNLLKYSKTNQRLYDKFLQSKTYEYEIHKNDRKLFESIKQTAKL